MRVRDEGLPPRPPTPELLRRPLAPAEAAGVAAWSYQRSLALCRRAGLGVERQLTGPGGRTFVELVRHLDR